MASINVAGRLAGKTAIITGASASAIASFGSHRLILRIGGGSGYGAGIAKLFAKQGAKVVVADINENGGKNTVQSMPENMRFHKTNVTIENDWKSLVEATQDHFGGIDCLINNAGTTYRNKERLSP